MAPTPTAEELLAYTKVVPRIVKLLQLASLVPVVLAGRFSNSAASRAAKQVARNEEAAKKKADGKQPLEKKEDLDEDDEDLLSYGSPIGFLSLVLLLSSEVIGARGLLQSGSKAEGSIWTLLKGVSRARKSSTQNMGALESGAFLAAEALKPDEAFDAAHSLVMMTALIAAVCGAVMNFVTPFLGRLFGGKPSQASNLLMLANGLLLPILLFYACHSEGLSKVGRAFAGSDQFLQDLQLFLRVGALLAARPNDGLGGTPPLFAALQAASLGASVSVELANGSLLKAISPLVQVAKSGSYAALLPKLIDSSVLTFIVPVSLALGSLTASHLHRSILHLIVMGSLVTVAAPLQLAQSWPTVASTLGLATKPGGLLFFLSGCYALTGSGLMLSGGTISMLAGMVMLQIVIRIHGADALAAAIS
eukprot:TRINITY_DN79499_c0_g1_i1.p1 TRINITY_DN79499_c0_g1~~TRINITY_DN79499_c0_g1_i1.p1  ORF type:complete len:420 (-),score=79.39 TRINITY_DN79499_c0_g1_i1:71-1330(-)